MKLIEGLKVQKDLARKIEDLREKIMKHASYSSLERPVYRDEAHPDDPKVQTEQVAKWVQSCNDLIKFMEHIRICIQYTNLVTQVTIEIAGKQVTKSIAQWVHWRRQFCDEVYKTHACLSDKRGVKEGYINTSQGEQVQVHIVRCYSPAKRDAVMEEYRELKHRIDSTLEIVNATTDMKEISDIPVPTQEEKPVAAEQEGESSGE